MRNIIKILIIVVTVSFIVCETIFIKVSKKETRKDYNLYEEATINEYVPVEEGGKRYTFVYADSYAPVQQRLYARIKKIPQSEIEVKDSSFYSIGEFLDKDSVLILKDDTSWTCESNYRITNITDNKLVIENTDEIYCSVSLYDSYSISFFDRLEFYTSISDTTIKLVPVSYSLNSATLDYTVELKIPYEKEVFSYQRLTIQLVTSFYIEGKYILSSFLMHDDNGYYVYKSVTLNNEMLYKRVNVTKIEEKGQYTIIASDELNENNKIIIYGR